MDEESNSNQVSKAKDDALASHVTLGGNAPPSMNQLKLYTPSELFKLPPLKWLIRNVLPEKGVAMILGISTAGKTFLAIDIAAHIALGQDWFGLKTRPAPVVYLGLEAQLGIQNRARAWEKFSMRTLPDLLRFYLNDFSLLEFELLTTLASSISDAGLAGGVIIIDTMSRATPGADENSPIDMGKIVQSASILQELTNSLVIVVHHKGKNESAGARGHTKLIAAVDACIAINVKGNQRSWSTDPSKGGKTKDSESITESFTLEVVDLGVDQDGEPVTSAVVVPSAAPATSTKRLSPSLTVAMNSFKNAAIATGKRDATGKFLGLAADDWRDEFYRVSTSDTQPAKKKAFQRARKDLVEQGFLAVNNDIYTTTELSASVQDAVNLMIGLSQSSQLSEGSTVQMELSVQNKSAESMAT